MILNKKLRTEIIEVPVGNASGTEFSWGASLPNLRDCAYIKRIEAFHSGQVSTSPNGLAVVSQATFQKSFLKLISGATEFKTISLVSLSKFTNGTVVEDVNIPAIDTEKTKVKVANNAGVQPNECYLFEITYEQK